MVAPVSEHQQHISIHALREEGDGQMTLIASQKADFYPRPPRGGRHGFARRVGRPANFYPRPPRGGRPLTPKTIYSKKSISIHALREEGDSNTSYQRAMADIFLSTPSARRATSVQERRCWQMAFLSTPSARRATYAHSLILPSLSDFYPRPPRGGRRSTASRASRMWNFYPRPPRGGRLPPSTRSLTRRLFLSTPSARRATGSSCRSGRSSSRFLSTPSARRATAKTETKSLFSYKLYNILHEFRRALIYNGSKNDPNHAKRHKNPVRRCRKNAENSPFAPGRKTQNNSRPSCSKGG